MKTAAASLIALTLLACSPASTTTTTTTTTTRRSAIDSSLVAAYSFDEGGGAVAYDATANHLDGSLAGPGWTAIGYHGGALSCGSGYATVADADVLDLTTGMTVEAWIYPTSNLGTWQAIAGKERPGNFAYMLFASNATKPITRITQSNGTATDLAAGTRPPANQWTHLAATFDGATLRLYEGGVLQASKVIAKPIGATTNPFRICGQSGSNVAFAGRVDDLRVYSRALSAAEIAADMATPVGGAGGAGGASGAGGAAGGSGGTGGGTGGSSTGGSSAGTTGGGGGIVTDAGSDASDAAGGAGGTGSGGALGLGVGSHAIAEVSVGQSATTVTTAPIVIQPGSLLVATVGRGNIGNFALAGYAPMDTAGDPSFAQVGATQAYLHPDELSGTALYTLAGSLGGGAVQVGATSGHASNGNYDEATLAVVEVVGGTHVQDWKWNEPAGSPSTSLSVTTTGPAILVAFWWGAGGATTSAMPDSSFQLADFYGAPDNESVQIGVATKVVAGAGTYGVTWTSVPAMGAQLWLVAVQ